jgi:hypothetical protein
MIQDSLLTRPQARLLPVAERPSVNIHVTPGIIKVAMLVLLIAATAHATVRKLVLLARKIVEFARQPAHHFGLGAMAIPRHFARHNGHD